MISLFKADTFTGLKLVSSAACKVRGTFVEEYCPDLLLWCYQTMFSTAMLQMNSTCTPCLFFHILSSLYLRVALDRPRSRAALETLLPATSMAY